MNFHFNSRLCLPSRMAAYRCVIFGVCMLLHISGARAEAIYTLEDVLSMAIAQNPVLQIAKAREAGASASTVTARAYQNPDLEMSAGPSRYRTPGGLGDNRNWSVSISQPLEFPSVREARQAMASGNLKAVSLNTQLATIDLEIRIKTAFYDVLQRQATFAMADGDRQILQDIRERVKVRVDVGESPRYELIKAETESLAAERDYQTALNQVLEAKAYLRGLVGLSMPAAFELVGDIPRNVSLPPVEALLDKVPETSQIAQLRAAVEAAAAKVKLEERLRTPGLTLKAGVEQDPDLQQFRLGLVVPIPVWNQRQGPIMEAAAELQQFQAMLSERELALNRDISAAYQRYNIAKQQLEAFDNGLLAQAESVLKVAEAAYRFGERGILDYLDAQRTYRVVRKDFQTARYAYVDAILEIQQLLGDSEVGEK